MIALSDTDTGGASVPWSQGSPHQHLAAGISLTCQRRGLMWLCVKLPHFLTLRLLLIHLTSISPPGVFHILFNELYS